MTLSDLQFIGSIIALVTATASTGFVVIKCLLERRMRAGTVLENPISYQLQYFDGDGWTSNRTQEKWTDPEQAVAARKRWVELWPTYESRIIKLETSVYDGSTNQQFTVNQLGPHDH
jgi:hypothetical protein